MSTSRPVNAHRARSMTVLALLILTALVGQLAVAVTPAAAGTTTLSGQAVRFGAYLPEFPRQSTTGLEAFEAELGSGLDIVHWFQSWDDTDPYGGQLRTDWVRSAGHRLPLISWEAWIPGDELAGPRLPAIAAGHHDAYLRSWARGLAEEGTPVWIRLMPEMNGEWVPWSGTMEGQTPADFVAAWRHVVDLFRSEGAGNVRWVWSPNETDVPATDDNRMERYYPGEDYVDVLAIDGYNWGAGGPGGWRSFSDIFADPYRRVTALGRQPVWIAETATAGSGGDRAAWVRDLFASSGLDRVEAVVWFHIDKEHDWRLSAVDGSLSATGAGLQSRETFSDIGGSVHRDAITLASREGVVSGCSMTRYCPSAPITRAQLASLLARALELDASTAPDAFTDDSGSPHESAINTLAAAGITAGCEPRRYCPSEGVSRAQAASLIAAAFEVPTGRQATSFVDITATSVHADAIAALAALDIVRGCAEDRFCPGGSVTRGQMATLLAGVSGWD